MPWFGVSPGRQAARDRVGPPNQKEGPADSPAQSRVFCRQRPKLRAVCPPRGAGKMLEECRPERGALTDGCGRGRARPGVAVGPFRRARLRPPWRRLGPDFQGPRHTSGTPTSSPGKSPSVVLNLSSWGRAAARLIPSPPGAQQTRKRMRSKPSLRLFFSLRNRTLVRKMVCKPQKDRKVVTFWTQTIMWCTWRVWRI